MIKFTHKKYIHETKCYSFRLKMDKDAIDAFATYLQLLNIKITKVNDNKGYIIYDSTIEISPLHYDWFINGFIYIESNMFFYKLLQDFKDLYEE